MIDFFKKRTTSSAVCIDYTIQNQWKRNLTGEIRFKGWLGKHSKQHLEADISALLSLHGFLLSPSSFFSNLW
jgi:hypothetical protein